MAKRTMPVRSKDWLKIVSDMLSPSKGVSVAFGS